jgi:hypothetical protein
MLPSDSPTGQGFSDLNRFLTPASLKTQRRQDGHGMASTPRPSFLGVFASLREPIRTLRGIGGSTPRDHRPTTKSTQNHPHGIRKASPVASSRLRPHPRARPQTGLTPLPHSPQQPRPSQGSNLRLDFVFDPDGDTDPDTDATFPGCVLRPTRGHRLRSLPDTFWGEGLGAGPASLGQGNHQRR